MIPVGSTSGRFGAAPSLLIGPFWGRFCCVLRAQALMYGRFLLALSHMRFVLGSTKQLLVVPRARLAQHKVQSKVMATPKEASVFF